MITVNINQQEFSFDKSNLNIIEVLQELDRAPEGIAIAKNDEVVPKLDWSNTFVISGDQILIIQATQGG